MSRSLGRGCFSTVVTLSIAIILPVLALLAWAFLPPYTVLAWERGLNSGSWTAGATLNVYVDTIPADAPAGTAAAVTNAIAAWTNAQAPFKGLVLAGGATKANADIHISWVKLANQGPKDPFGATAKLDNVDMTNNGFTKKTVRMTIRYDKGRDGTALTANGVQGILTHELGHAEGLGHSADSALMKGTAFNNNAAGLNAGGATTPPTDDDKAGKKGLWGTVEKLSESTTEAAVTPIGDQYQYQYTVQAATQCGTGACTDNITAFAVEIPMSVVSDVVITPPPSWNFQILSDVIQSGGEQLDNQPFGSPLISFTADSPSSGIAPGSTAIFQIQTSVGPGNVRTFTNSPDWDSDEAIVNGPADSEDIPTIPHWELIVFGFLLITTTGYLFMRFRGLRPE